ncbi:MAG: hypothetical protein DRH70_08105, partial [Candidatus Coatesbacteria bacterium]
MRDVDNTRGTTVHEPSLQNIVDSIQDGISVLDSNLDIMKVNRRMEKMYTTY